MTDEITVVVIDDHPLFRQGVIDSLSLEPDLSIVGQAEDGQRGLEVIRKFRPQVAVVDVNLPDMNGQVLTLRVSAEKLPTRVVLLTAYDDHGQRIYGLRAGASAYSSKDIQPEALARMVRIVAAGWYVVGDQVFDAPEMNNWLMTQIPGGAAETDERLRDLPYQLLSEREMEVLKCIASGLSNKEIALALGISHQTVKNHVTSILHKLGVEDRTQAVLYALRYGWVRLHGNSSNSQ
jgi:DNA-binding NarL/FixJ family response regulator